MDDLTSFDCVFLVSLQITINRVGCGTDKICAATPDGCDPSATSSCFFLSAKQISGQNYDFELTGENDGFVSASLSTDAVAVGGVQSLSPG